MAKDDNEIFETEKELKNSVYKCLDEKRKNDDDNVSAKKEDYERGSYEEQDSHLMRVKLTKAEKERDTEENLISLLEPKPYFAHMEVDIEDELDNIFLSDNEKLDESFSVEYKEDGESKYIGRILPFKFDNKRPVSNALSRCYRAKDGKISSYKVEIKGKILDVSIKPNIICDVEIADREVLAVKKYYPAPVVVIDKKAGEMSNLTSDELLQKMLDENRNNPELSNIISTIQSQQYEIIENGIDENFVVQGCAGSGKSQCLIHRLFFFRGELNKKWNRVLLITPTSLFRQYSSTLMKRYGLTGVNNCSIANLYKNLLEKYDSRFSDRQYEYEMTEEYLPDRYLKAVYNEEIVNRIDREIDSAISSYVEAGCNALSIPMPEDITINAINDIVEQLGAQIELFDAREAALADNDEYQNKRNEYEAVLKKLELSKKKMDRLKDSLINNTSKYEPLSMIIEEMESHKTTKKELLKRKGILQKEIDELKRIADEFDNDMDILTPARYAKQLRVVKDMSRDVFTYDDQIELETLDVLIDESLTRIGDITKDKNPKNALNRYKKRIVEIQEDIKDLSKHIDDLTIKTRELEESLLSTSISDEGDDDTKVLVKTDLQQAMYLLSRIESSIFEKEVWNSLTPIKEEYEIETLRIEVLEDGKHKESRILYKVDLIFYMLIYMKLHPSKKLPKYSIICIDEGQDLHRIDYDILHKLFPKAVFNVFGDLGQVLHSACGIKNWEDETGISNIYSINTNYRNTPSIVDFCNNTFDTEMGYIGNVNNYKKPSVLSDVDEIVEVLSDENVVVIVKDIKAYDDLCELTALEYSEYVFLDTNSEKTDSGTKECYSIYAAKGLEFSKVFVYAKRMNKNQKVVACTRATGELYYYE